MEADKTGFYDESQTKYINEHFAVRLKKAFKLRDVNIKQFAKEAGLSRAVIYKYLNKEINPSFEVINKIAYELQLPFEFFSQDYCIIGDYVYKWDDNALMIKVKDKDNHHRSYQDIITRDKDKKRKTNDDYSFLQLLSMRADSMQARNEFIRLLDTVESEVDEPTKELITALLVDTGLELAKIRNDYLDFKKKQNEDQ